MSPHFITPLANGSRTDHPFENCPFVDDCMLEHLDDPQWIASVGAGIAASRNKRSDSWGRWAPMKAPISPSEEFDAVRDPWVASTVIPSHPQYAWVVRSHPKLGRVVALYTADDAQAVFEQSQGGITVGEGSQMELQAQFFQWLLSRVADVREHLDGNPPYAVQAAGPILDQVSLIEDDWSGEDWQANELVTWAAGRFPWVTSLPKDKYKVLMVLPLEVQRSGWWEQLLRRLVGWL